MLKNDTDTSYQSGFVELPVHCDFPLPINGDDVKINGPMVCGPEAVNIGII